MSEAAIADGIRAGHTYVKLFGNDGPDLQLEEAGEADRRILALASPIYVPEPSAAELGMGLAAGAARQLAPARARRLGSRAPLSPR